VLAQRRLADAELLSNEHGTNAILEQIAVHLPRKVLGRPLQPFEYLKPAGVAHRLYCSQINHIVSLPIDELCINRESSAMNESLITPPQISVAYQTIAPHIRRTPIIEVDAADFGIACAAPLALKLELLQHAGSFKARGAFTSLLTRNIPAAGVVAASGGNHGAAIAFAAMKLSVPAKIFVPSIASPAKIQQISNYGAQLVVGGDRYADALAASEAWAADSGALPIHAYDQRETILGQGTVGVEFEQQAPVTTLMVAVGGGGLIAGITAWFDGRIKIIAVEPENAPTLTRALEAGRPVDAMVSGIAADSLGARRVGELAFPIISRHVEKTVLVSDDAIFDAQRRLWTTLRVVAEPGGVAALAALTSGAYVPSANERVGVLICGGNTAAVNFKQH
jgi:threonine dehydratase